MVSKRRVDLKVIPGGFRGRAGAPPPAPRTPRKLFGPGADPPAETVGPSETGLRPVDVLTLAYLGVTTCLLLAFQANLDAWGALVLAHGLAAVVILRLGAVRPPAHPALAFVRDFYPLPMMAVFYMELGLLTQLSGAGPHDAAIAAFENAIFGFQPSQRLHELWPFWPLSQYLHAAYFLYYFVPVSLSLPLWVGGRWLAFQETLTTTMLAFYTCCAFYVAYPVAGPYHFYGPPDPAALGGGMAGLAHGVVQGASSVGTAFPSSHTAVAVAVWVAALRLDGRIFWGLVFVVPALMLGTVYGGFHYAVDTLLGLLWGGLAGVLGPRLHGFLAQRLPRPEAGRREPRIRPLPKSEGGT